MRPRPHARDVHPAYTNEVLTGVISMVAQMMHTVGLLAEHSCMTQRLTAIVAQQLAESAALGQECLHKRDSEGQPAIRAASVPDAGAVLTSNITTLVSVAQDMRTCVLQQAAHTERGRLM